MADKNTVKQLWQKHKLALGVLFSTWGLYFLALWPRIISMKPDGLYFGQVNVWSDWALHIGIASIFAYKPPSIWFAYHPMFATGKFNYPFLADFISGMLMRIGLPLYFAFVTPSIIFTAFLLLGMYVLFYLTLNSQKKALLAISLFFLSSGLGFVNFIKDFSQNPNLQLFLYPVKEYSRLDVYQWYSGNVAVGLLIPQRAYLLGVTLAVWIMAGFLYVFLKSEPAKGQDKTILVVCGILAGVLPITHMHTFIVVVVITGLLCLCLIKKWKLLLYYVVPAGILSTLLYVIFIYGSIQNPSQFFVWQPGWVIVGGFLPWVKIWLYLFGIMIPLAILGWCILTKKAPSLVQNFFLGFFLLFILGNLFLIQPIPWDNSKLFFWAYFGFSGLATIAISWVWQQKFNGRALAILLVFVLVATGALELIRLQRVDQNQVQETSADDIQLGLQIREKTDPLAVFLTTTSHNHFVMMWGVRPILMGYSAWVSNYGFSYQQTEQDIGIMYAGGRATENLLKKYHISYVVIGPGEKNDFQANEDYFKLHFPVAFRNQSYHIYDVRKIYQ